MSSPLRDKFIRHMVLQGFSPHTQAAYLRAVVELVRYYRCRPDELTNDQIQGFLQELIEVRKRTWSTVNVYFSAFRYLYRQVLGWEQSRFSIPPRGRIKHKPMLLSREEVSRLIQAAGNAKHRALLMTAYGAGLRVSELVQLKLSHIESSPDRMMIRVEQGKGRKDRYTVLFDWVLEELRGYWCEYRPVLWLFVGQDPSRHLTVSSAQRAYCQAREAAGITRGRGIHTLRHCFASHLLESGVDLFALKRLLGHASLQTTAGYLHVGRVQNRPLRSPLDELDLPK